MSREEIYERLNEVFQDVFGDDDITVNDETTAADVDGWDSLRHITLLAAIEDEFDIEFEFGEDDSKLAGIVTVEDAINLMKEYAE